MNISAIAVHLVTEENTWLLNRVDDDVFDHKIQPALLQAFLANPANLLVAWVATEVDNTAARGLYAAVGGKEDDERAVVYTYSLADEQGKAAANQAFQRTLED